MEPDSLPRTGRAENICHDSRRPMLWLADPRCIRPAVAGFVLLALASAMLFSGGNNLDPQAPHFDPVRNFLCDLFMLRNTYNGRTNVLGGVLGIAGGLLLVAGGLLPTWVAVAPRLRPASALSRVIVALGVLAICAVAVVPLEQLIALPLPHHLLLLAAVVPAWFATSGVALLGLRHPDIGRTAQVLGVVVLLAVPAIFASYLPHALAGEQTPPAVALGQKLVLVAVLAWLWALGGSPALRT